MGRVGYRWECDVCGKRDCWREGWRRYGNILLEEICPEQLPVVCSEGCANAATEKIETGEWKLPKAYRDGYVTRLSRNKSGY